MHQEIQVDIDHVFTFDIFDKNIQTVPASGTITIQNNSGTDVVAETAVAVATDGTMSYTFSASDNDALDVNYKITLKWVESGTTKYKYFLFDVVRTPLVNEVRDDDLYPHIEELRTKIKPIVSQTTASGTTTTFKSTRLKADDRSFKGGYVEIYITNTIVHEAIVTAHTAGDDTVTFSPAYTSSIASGLTYRIRPSYQQKIDEAFDNFVYREIRNKMGIAARYIDTQVTRNMVVFKTLAMICLQSIKEDGDRWSIRYNHFEQMYKDEYSRLKEPYDENGDGNISTTEDKDRPCYSTTSIIR
jgi:hypothetical protein